MVGWLTAKEWLQDTRLYRVWHWLRIGWRPKRPLSPAELKNQQYDEQLVHLMALRLAPDSVCIDGGCHTGAVLREMSRLAPRAAHYAFEPLPHLHRRLRRRFPRQHILCEALSDQVGDAAFVHVAAAPAYSGLRKRRYDNPAVATTEIPVRLTTLDRAIPATTAIAFIKLDLEGGEYHALKGGVATIRRCRPFIAFEAGESSTGFYQVTGDMLFSLFADELDYHLSTMERWLAGERAGFSREAFLQAYTTEFFFLAYPRGVIA